MLYTLPNFNGALLNFGLFLKLGAPSRLGLRGRLPPYPALSAALCMYPKISQTLIYEIGFKSLKDTQVPNRRATQV